MKTLYFQNCLGVFQGGGCRAAAYVGAYREALDRGVTFSEIVGTSAGAIVSTLIAAGADSDTLEKFIKELDFQSLLSSPEELNIKKVDLITKLTKFTKYKQLSIIASRLGLYTSKNIETWLEEKLRILLPNKKSPIRFKDLIIPETVVATDIIRKKVKLWSSKHTPDELVSQAVRASCSIPFFFQPVDKKYVDGGALSNLPSFVFQEDLTSYSRILAFTLVSDSKLDEIQSINDFVDCLTSTVIDGAQELQLQLQKNLHIINIPTGKLQATDFNKMDKDNISQLILNGKTATASFFDSEIVNVKNNSSIADISHSHSRTYHSLAQTVDQTVDEVVISERNTSWVYDLFPTLVHWASSGAKISVYLRKDRDNIEHGPFQVRLLKCLGANVTFLDSLPLRCFIINPAQPDNSFAIVKKYSEGSVTFDSIVYDGSYNYQVIKALNSVVNQVKNTNANSIPSLEEINIATHYDALKKIHQYSHRSVSFDFAELNIENLVFLTKYVRSYRYKQIRKLIEYYDDNQIPLFNPTKFTYPNGKSTLVGLPVVELHSDKYFIIEGSTRLTHCHRNSIDKVKVIIVKGVTTPLPSSGTFSVNEIIITEHPVEGETRYNNFNYNYYRRIEKAFRDPATCLLDGDADDNS